MKVYFTPGKGKYLLNGNRAHRKVEFEGTPAGKLTNKERIEAA